MAKAEYTGPNLHDVHSSAKKVGCLDIVVPRGPLHLCEVPGLLTTAVYANGNDKPATSVGVIAYRDPRPSGQGHGYLAQLDANAAREIAASLLKLADQVDPGRMN